MIKKLLLLAFMSVSLSAAAQNWSGSTPGNIYYNGGNVGIGISSPGTKLDVRGNIRFSGATNGSTGVGDGFTHFSHGNGNNYIRGNTYLQTSGLVAINAGGKTVITGGNVGIGTETPTEQLEVAGKIKMYGQPSPRHDNSISGYVLQSSHFYGHTNTENIYVGEEGNTVFLRGMLNVGLNASVNGNLGIGISSPSTKLDVRGNIRFSGATNGSSGIGDGFTHFSHGNGNNYIRGNTYLQTSGLVEINAQSKTVITGGNVGIGTSNPGTFKLAVEGKIGAREVQVTATSPWPDYVFEEDYALTSLEELESHLKEKKHLPGIPTAKEVEENGVNLGEMNAKLLEKVEELTLYVIDVNHQTNSLNEQVKALQASNQLLEEQNNLLKQQLELLVSSNEENE
ncbi:tail fiber protein [Fulvivirga imtechensis]|nr:tail fiber protein [Fulvivirga imtechensis]